MTVINQTIEVLPVDKLIPYARNSRTHSDAQVAQIAASIREFGFTNPVLIDADGGIIAGHGRVLGARKLGMAAVPCIRLGYLTETQKRAYVIADNKIALNAGWDEDMLATELQELADMDFDLDLTGFDPSEIDDLLNDEEIFKKDKEKAGNMIAEFGYAPFSVLDARRGEWIDRKRWWNEKIGDDGETREGTLMGDGLPGYKIRTVSLLDPVMSEVVVNWFGLQGGVAFDPFAGDSVFGYVSSYLGMTFKGIELRKEQAELNQSRASAAGLDAVYYCDTSENMGEYIEDESIDLVFSCPPYADLEVYSDDPRDLSTMPHDSFFKIYENILSQTYNKLKNNRFAVIVMGEVRGKSGAYIGTIPNTIKIMERAGYSYYNEMILITQNGSLALRVGKQMRATRKIGKTHQNILIFVKGDGKKAANEIGKIRGLVEIDEKLNEEGVIYE